MNTLIIYGSQYGTTKRYAEKFAEMTDFPVISYEDIKTLTDYERIIYFGGLYAGGIKGSAKNVKKTRGAGERTLFIRTRWDMTCSRRSIIMEMN